MKLRGIGQTQRRFFRLSNKRFGFFTKDSGDQIDAVTIDDITAVSGQRAHIYIYVYVWGVSESIRGPRGCLDVIVLLRASEWVSESE